MYVSKIDEVQTGEICYLVNIGSQVSLSLFLVIRSLLDWVLQTEDECKSDFYIIAPNQVGYELQERERERDLATNVNKITDFSRLYLIYFLHYCTQSSRLRITRKRERETWLPMLTR
jgi:hypothetical protein